MSSTLDLAARYDAAHMLHTLLPRSQVIVMPHVGHIPMVERPQQTAQDYLRFRAGLDAGDRSSP